VAWKQAQEQNMLANMEAENLRSSVIFVGNPGCGKSTLLNSILRELKFTRGRGVCVTRQEHEKDGVTYVATTGLRQQLAREISTAFRNRGSIRLFFVCTFEAGNCREDDVVTMNFVLETLRDVPMIKQGHYGVIFNKVSKKMLLIMREDQKSAAIVVGQLFSRLPVGVGRGHVHFYAFSAEAIDSDGYLLPRKDDFLCFLSSFPPFFIGSTETVLELVDKPGSKTSVQTGAVSTMHSSNSNNEKKALPSSSNKFCMGCGKLSADALCSGCTFPSLKEVWDRFNSS
jgi:energy-coupling factor transporter ATP-binding protein EcfA2